MKTYLLETTSESLAPVKLAFRAVMENRIPQRMRNCLAGLYRELVPGLTFQQVARVRAFVADEAYAADAHGLDDLAGSIYNVSSELSAVLDGMDYCLDSEDWAVCAVNEVYIDFASGKISGDCSGCNAAQVADALMTIVAALQVMDDTPDYIDYDEGKVFVG